ncbi:uncharacterized protein PV09_06959 [Verruconis gallopava]|uniref:Uncharacterized protein n=1 Tax=Verruconis gallopava TaxID=253628 RepID=A0A0D1YLS5_9PEZI|nr:uncharacterized protein PV09_06959 [Verruconis gallopava]KIW01787.1 hypothetical protein PV09_06959 [Verruconis gallopava]
MSEDEKVTFGATVESRPAPPPLSPSKPNSMTDAPPSPLTTTSFTPAHESADPFDPPWTQGGPNRASADHKQPHITTHDLESQRELGLALTGSSRTGCKRKEDSMWPSLKTQKARAKQQKREKSCNPMARMGRKQKLIATLVIALLVVGAAVGIGVGVSKAVGGGVTQVGGGTRPIGDGQKRL